MAIAEVRNASATVRRPGRPRQRIAPLRDRNEMGYGRQYHDLLTPAQERLPAAGGKRGGWLFELWARGGDPGPYVAMKSLRGKSGVHDTGGRSKSVDPLIGLSGWSVALEFDNETW